MLFNKTKKIDLAKFTQNNEAILCCTKIDCKILKKYNKIMFLF